MQRTIHDEVQATNHRMVVLLYPLSYRTGWFWPELNRRPVESQAHSWNKKWSKKTTTKDA